jgi:RNA polymerase sigma-70 factor (ECF subfamily)
VAEEVVQETWLAVLQGLGAFEGRSSLKTWIFRILSNRAKTRGKREGRMVPFPTLGGPSGEEGDEPAVDPARFSPDGHWRDPPRTWGSESPEDLLLRAEIRASVERALADLPPAQRAVVTLRDVEGFESDETCAALDISEANQRVLLHRGRARVRRALEGVLDRAKRGR